MKKIIAALICAAVCLVTGCSKSETSGGSQLPTSTSSSITNPVRQSSVTPATSVPTSKPTSSKQSSSETSEPTSEPIAARGEFRRGKWSGDSFISYFFGYKLDLDGWTKETDEQIAQRNSLVDMSDSTLNNAVEQSNENTMVYEAFAQDANANTLAVGVNRYNGKTIDEYTQANVNGMKLAASFKDVRSDKVNIAGKAQPCIYATYTSGIIDVYEIIVIYQNGDYFSVITIGAFSQSDLQNTVDSVFAGASTPSSGTSEPSADNGAFQRGKWNGNTFVSDFFGFKVAFGSDWEQSSDSLLETLNGVPDALFVSAVERSTEDDMFYEVYAQNDVADFTVSVLYNKCGGKTENEYAELQANHSKGLTDWIKDVKLDTVNIAGKSHPCIYSTYINQDADKYGADIIYKNGDYFAVITVGAASKSDLQSTIKSMLG